MRDRRHQSDGRPRNSLWRGTRRADLVEPRQRHVAIERRELGAVRGERRSAGRRGGLRYVWQKEGLIWSAPAERSGDGALDLIIRSLVYQTDPKRRRWRRTPNWMSTPEGAL